MDVDQLNDPSVTPSKSLRNVHLSPLSKANRRKAESSPIQPICKTDDSIGDPGAYADTLSKTCTDCE